VVDRKLDPYEEAVEDQLAAEEAYDNLRAIARKHPMVRKLGEFQATQRWYLAANRALALATKLAALDGTGDGAHSQQYN
jgi:hypothetical protein